MQLPSTLPQLNPNQRGLANTMRSTGFKGPSAGVPQDLSFQKELSQTLGARQHPRLPRPGESHRIASHRSLFCPVSM